jgi:hypothetical protein
MPRPAEWSADEAEELPMSVLLTRLTALLAILAVTGGVAQADPNLNCDAYAGAAVAQNQQNIAQGCGLKGGAWSSDFNAHRNWCRAPATTMADLTAEDNARNAALAQCAGKPKLDQQACQVYAKKAVIAAEAAASHACGFKGGRWSADYSAHFGWCLAADSGARTSEDSARGNQLQGCLDAQATAAETAKKDACAKYAAAAVASQKENDGRQCHFTGGRWAGDYFAHFKWCIGVGPQTAAKETGIRVAALKNDCMMKVCKTEDIVSVTPPFLSSRTTCKFVPKPWH